MKTLDPRFPRPAGRRAASAAARRAIGHAAVVLGLSACGPKAAPPEPSATDATPGEADPIRIEHTRYELDNGLTVVLAPDRSTPIVHTQVWYHVGSKDETAGLTGFAHLFEHLMFQGSLNSPGEYFTPVQEVGGTLNGTTNADRTNYFETVPSRYLPMALFLESDRMGNLLPVLDQGKLDNQRDVVRNERRQRYENRPYGDAAILLFELLYPKGHPYRHPTIGSHEDLENAALDDVKAFFRTWYGPQNATLVVAGDFDEEQARAMVEEQFGWIPRGATPERARPADPSLSETVKRETRGDVPDAKLFMAWHSPPFFAPGDAALDVAATVLCSGKDARMYRALVRDRGIARDVSCGQASRKLGSYFYLDATAAEGHTLDEILAVVDEVLPGMTTSPPTADEVQAAVTSYETGFYRRLATIEGRAGQLSSYLFFTGDSDFVERDRQRYLDLGPNDVQKAVDTWLLAPRVELHYLPEAE